MQNLINKLSFLSIENLKVKAALGIIGSTVIVQLGGWDQLLSALIAFMIIDYVSGLAVAICWKSSPKSDSGGFSSNSGMKGLIKKAVMLIMVYIAVKLEMVLGMQNGFVRNSIIVGLAVNELGSIGENFKIMGIPFLPELLDVIKTFKDLGNKKER